MPASETSNETLHVTLQTPSKMAKSNMEIYAYTLRRNITIDVKKKKGGARSIVKSDNIRRQTRTERAISAPSPNFSLFRNAHAQHGNTRVSITLQHYI